jgi:hypothetical protein
MLYTDGQSEKMIIIFRTVHVKRERERGVGVPSMEDRGKREHTGEGRGTTSKL